MPNHPDDQGTIRYLRCPSCGAPNPATAPTCFRCSKPLQAESAASPQPQRAPAPAQTACPKCGKPLPAGSKFCGFCGASLAAAPSPSTPTPAPPPPSTPKRVSPDPNATTPIKPPTAQTPPPLRHPLPPPPPIQPAPPRPVPPLPKMGGPPAQGPADATVVFPGLKAAALEATLLEIKSDGSTGKNLKVVKEVFVGQANCDFSYPSDVLLAPRHASIQIRQGKLILKDLGSQNGTFIKQRQDTELKAGDVFLLGRELFRFGTQAMDEGQKPPSLEGTWLMTSPAKLQRGPATATLEHIQLTGEVTEVHKLDKPETTLGRTTGDLVFPNDPYMSGTHARILAQPGRFVLQDMKSRNGIYRRIKDELELKDGDEFFLGEQRFRVGLKTS